MMLALPTETLQTILALLSPADANRLRAVCRRFDACVCAPAFAALNLARTCETFPEDDDQHVSRHRFTTTDTNASAYSPSPRDMAWFDPRWPDTYKAAHARLFLADSPFTRTEIAWSRAGIVGHLPSQICALSQTLQSLCLDHNSLSGKIPDEICTLGSLRCLNLSNNAFSGSIPRNIGNLSELRYLFLEENNLSGTLPTSMGNLAHLEKLVANKNELSGSIPAELGCLSKLHTLNLSHNCLSGLIPTEIGGLANLRFCKLACNQLYGPLPSEIGHLVKLQGFWANQNSLSGEIPKNIGTLVNLWQINLSRNKFTGRVPCEIKNFAFLNYLNLSENDDLIKVVDEVVQENERCWKFLREQGFVLSSQPTASIGVSTL
ncbi:hypothetical protein HDU83_008730 [Entophlyctis luteolus]|nr:hypothetical protein HDU82_004226 [Entophlyctis luteolus]KAJ3351703.1 hypothetical protein HDU83_008730 [Entophlyctis luteolus]KAJ3390714.1 hypothetical protein HDU84_007116 [Entophlyctis sp. JEL0112]